MWGNFLFIYDLHYSKAGLFFNVLKVGLFDFVFECLLPSLTLSTLQRTIVFIVLDWTKAVCRDERVIEII